MVSDMRHLGESSSIILLFCRPVTYWGLKEVSKVVKLCVIEFYGGFYFTFAHGGCTHWSGEEGPSFLDPCASQVFSTSSLFSPSVCSLAPPSSPFSSRMLGFQRRYSSCTLPDRYFMGKLTQTGWRHPSFCLAPYLWSHCSGELDRGPRTTTIFFEVARLLSRFGPLSLQAFRVYL